MVCPLCGRKSEVGMFCGECYLKKNLTIELPEKLELSHCRDCNAFLLSGKWLRDISTEDAILAFVKKSLKSNINKLDKAGVLKFEVKEARGAYEATVSVVIGDSEVRKTAFVVIRNNACPDCSRMAGGYFEAVLQMRGGVGKSTIEKITKEIEGYKDRLSFVGEVKRVQGGYDIYVGSKKAAEKVVRGFGDAVEVKKSFKQAGFDRQAGKAQNRFYYLVRL
jgi:nonsense-mediated mRNA decay protein 3